MIRELFCILITAAGLLFVATFTVNFPQEYTSAKEVTRAYDASFVETSTYVGICKDPVRMALEGLEDECKRRATVRTASPIAVATYNSLRKSIRGSSEVVTLVGLDANVSNMTSWAAIAAFVLGIAAAMYVASRMRPVQRQVVPSPADHFLMLENTDPTPWGGPHRWSRSAEKAKIV